MFKSRWEFHVSEIFRCSCGYDAANVENVNPLVCCLKYCIHVAENARQAGSICASYKSKAHWKPYLSHSAYYIDSISGATIHCSIKFIDGATELSCYIR